MKLSDTSYLTVKGIKETSQGRYSVQNWKRVKYTLDKEMQTVRTFKDYEKIERLRKAINKYMGI